jgi:hypothetical protein
VTRRRSICTSTMFWSRKTAVAIRPTWADGQRVMKQSEIGACVVLGRGRLDTV